MISGEHQHYKPMTLLREQGKLVLELCHFTQDLNPLWQTSALLNRLKDLSGKVISSSVALPNQDQQFTRIVDYFFNELGFQAKEKCKNLQSCLLPQVLSSREGPTPLLMLLFCSLAEEVGIRTQISSCRKKFLLKVQLDGKTHVVDFAKKCKPLKPYEIVDLINRGFDFSGGSLRSDILVVEYLNQVKQLSRTENRLQILSLVHSYLMRYQPFNLKHLSERAVVAYETGDYKTAIEDIRSYFLYKQPELNNINLKRIYKNALKHVRRLES